MSFTYEKLSKEIELIRTYLEQSNISLKEDPVNFQNLIDKKKIGVQISANNSVYNTKDKKELFRCSFFIKVSFTNKDEKDENNKEKELGVIEVSFSALYQHPELHKYSDDVRKEFSNKNAIFNLFPFFRQYIFDITGKFGIQPYILPIMLRNDIQQSYSKAKNTSKKK